MEDVTRIENGRAVVYRRGGSFHVRILTSPNKYIYRTLKTGNKEEAIKAAQKIYYEVEFKRQHNLPVKNKKYADVLDEYIAFRIKQHEQGHTSAAMLRQIMRVSKFWREYAGKKSISSIDNTVLKEFVQWRKDYYAKFTDKELPNNAKRNPTDKTLQWEMTFGKQVIKWADERGYRGKIPLPTYSFVPKKNRVRPAFEPFELSIISMAITFRLMEHQKTEKGKIHALLHAYFNILTATGMRVGEANNLKMRDVIEFEDGKGRNTYRFVVRGKTGERDVIPEAKAARVIRQWQAYRRNADADDYFFVMPAGNKIITLADQFNAVLKAAELETNAAGEKYSLYSLRHTYAVRALREGIDVFALARNMGTSVEIIQSYYGKQATPMKMADRLGREVEDDTFEKIFEQKRNK